MEEDIEGLSSLSSTPLVRLTSMRRKTIVRKAVATMTDAPLFVILDFRWGGYLAYHIAWGGKIRRMA